jgi:S1-C subfamily serine protease
MKKATTLSLALVLCLGGPLVAQDATQPRTGATTEGRNAWLNKAFTKVADGASQHVVVLRSTRSSEHLGYGVIVEGGYVLTCDSVVPKSKPSVNASTRAGVSFTATVAGRDRANDIALLRIVGADAPAGIALGSSKALAIGQFVGTIGTSASPLCVGVVSAKNRPVEPAKQQKNILMGLFSDGNNGPSRHYPNVLQHDAPLQPEHFGAPLVNGKGQLVGINVAAPYRGSSHAVGIDQIQTFLGGLKSTAARPWLGVSAAEVQQGLPRGYAFGLEVREVQAGSPAASSSLRKGDVILAANGKKLAGFDAFADLIRSTKPGVVITFSVLRGGTVMVDVPVTIGAR